MWARRERAGRPWSLRGYRQRRRRLLKSRHRRLPVPAGDAEKLPLVDGGVDGEDEGDGVEELEPLRCVVAEDDVEVQKRGDDRDDEAEHDGPGTVDQQENAV